MKETNAGLWITLFVTLVFVCGLSIGIAVSVLLGSRTDGGGVRGQLRPAGPLGASPAVRVRANSQPARTRDRPEAGATRTVSKRCSPSARTAFSNSIETCVDALNPSKRDCERISPRS